MLSMPPYSNEFQMSTYSTSDMTHEAHLPRRGQFGPHTAAAPAQGHLNLPTGQGDPHQHHGRDTLSPRADIMGKMNDIIDYVLRSAAAKDLLIKMIRTKMLLKMQV